jgi:hypothetical protein
MAAVPEAVEVSARESYRDRLDDLRCHETAWLRARRVELVKEQRRLHVEELAVLRVLDERDALSRMPDPKVSARTTKTNLELARALEALPAIAAQLAEGELSVEQAAPLAQLATPETDREWALRGPNVSPIDLQALVRRQERPSAGDAAARREARMLRIWREQHSGMVVGRFRLADVDGVLLEKVFLELTEKMRPAKGQAWDSLDHRQADALVQLCRDYSDVEVTQRTRSRPQVIIHRRHDGRVDCDGIPLADTTVEDLLGHATIKVRTEDAHGLEQHTTRARAATPHDHHPQPGPPHTAQLIDGLTLADPDGEHPHARAGPDP